MSPTTNSVNASLWRIKKSTRALPTDRTPRPTRAAGSDAASSRLAISSVLQNALERVFVLGSKRENIRYFPLGFVASVGAADRAAFIVDAMHERSGFVLRHPKKTFQHYYDEDHRSVVVVQQQYVAPREVRHRGPLLWQASEQGRCWPDRHVHRDRSPWRVMHPTR